MFLFRLPCGCVAVHVDVPKCIRMIERCGADIGSPHPPEDGNVKAGRFLTEEEAAPYFDTLEKLIREESLFSEHIASKLTLAAMFE